MTTTLAADASNDLFVNGSGVLATRTGLQAVLQVCEHAAKTVRGEMLFAVDQGLPYFTTAWAGSPNRPQFEAALRRALLAVPDVLDIVELETEAANNTLSYRVTIKTIYGVGAFNA